MPFGLGDFKLPASYPRQAHEDYHLRADAVFTKYPAAAAQKDEYGGAMRSIPYRYKAAWESSDLYATSVQTKGAGPPPLERYRQERDFFSFVMNSMACLEALHYSLFAVSAADPARRLGFTGNDKRVSPKGVLAKLAQCSHSPTNVAKELKNLQNDATFKRLHQWRVILFHRLLPARTIYGSTKAAPSPSGEYKPFDTQSGPKIAPNLTRDSLTWLEQSLQLVMEAAVKDF